MQKGPGCANICDKLTHYYAEGTELSMRARFGRFSAPRGAQSERRVSLNGAKRRSTENFGRVVETPWAARTATGPPGRRASPDAPARFQVLRRNSLNGPFGNRGAHRPAHAGQHRSENAPE